MHRNLLFRFSPMNYRSDLVICHVKKINEFRKFVVNGTRPIGFYIRPYKTLRTRIQLCVIGKIKSKLEQDLCFKNRKLCIPRFSNHPILKVDDVDVDGKPVIDGKGNRKCTSYHFKKCLET